MEKVVDITQRLKAKAKEEDADRKRFETLRRSVYCFLCQFRCSMCGIQITPTVETVLNLCEHCGSEYRDYKQFREGKVTEPKPWQDLSWARLWETWEAMREAVMDYRSFLDGLET